MATSEFPSNSNFGKVAPKEPLPEKDVQRVTTGAVVMKKAGLGEKFKLFFNIVDGRSTAQYVVNDVILPGLRNMIVDTASRGVERLMYGDSAPRRSRTVGPTYNQPRVQYNSPSPRFGSTQPPMRGFNLPDQPPRGVFWQNRPDFGDIVLSSREEADLVLERLTDIVDKYDVATVADYKELVGLPSAHVDQKWGWSSLTFSNIRQTRDGFMLNLPPTESI